MKLNISIDNYNVNNCQLTELSEYSLHLLVCHISRRGISECTQIILSYTHNKTAIYFR